jgi:hypothetical protein
MEKTLIDWIGENGMTDEVKKEETKCFKCKKEVLNKHFVNIYKHSECLKCTN